MRRVKVTRVLLRSRLHQVAQYRWYNGYCLLLLVPCCNSVCKYTGRLRRHRATCVECMTKVHMAEANR